MEAKEDNIEDSYTDSVDSYVVEDSDNGFNKDYYSISGNLRFEHSMIMKLKASLGNLNAISVQDIETLIGYAKDIDELMLILMDYHHTLKALEEFEKVFKLKKVNGGVFVIQVFRRHRRRKKRISKRHRKKLKL